MVNHKFDFDPSKLKKVPIDDVVPNGYNPKEKDTKEFKKVVRSIEINGLRQPVPVREKDGKYVIIDGEQRYTAAKEIGYTEITIYNEGEVSDADAKALTLWYEVQVPFEEVDLSKLVVELDDMQMELPYTEVEIAEFRHMAEFDFNFEQDMPDKDPADGLVTFTVRMTPDQRDIINQAIERVQSEQDCSDGRALELISADFLGN